MGYPVLIRSNKKGGYEVENNLDYNFNQLGIRIGDIADKTSKGLSEIQLEVNQLSSSLALTNTLLGVLILLVMLNVFLNFKRK